VQYCHLSPVSFAIALGVFRSNLLFFVSVMGEIYLDDEDFEVFTAVIVQVVVF
jgi:hypothetical protein